MNELFQLTWVFNRSFSMPCESFSMLDRPGGTGCMLHILTKGPKLNPTEQYEIYKHYEQSPTNILNDQIHYKSHTLFDTIKHSSHNNISDIPTTTNRNIAACSTGTVKHWKWWTWHRKASAKNSSKLNKFLHSEVNELIQHINVNFCPE